MLKSKYQIFLFLFSIFYFSFSIFLSVQARADTPNSVAPKSETLKILEEVAKQAGYQVEKKDPILIVARIINYFLSFLGLVAVLIIIYGGFLWMTAAGNEEKVGKGKKTLIQGLIGLLIVILSLVIYNFVVWLLPGRKGGGVAGPS